jgi:hypothetical protein
MPQQISRYLTLIPGIRGRTFVLAGPPANVGADRAFSGPAIHVNLRERPLALSSGRDPPHTI